MTYVVSLCDLTAAMVRPWVEAGYDAFLVDPQHGATRTEGGITKFAGTIEDALPELSALIRREEIAMVFGFPPCTNLAVSGARHFERKMTDKNWKHYQGPNMFFDAVRVAWQCEMVGQLSGSPWMVENPVSRLATFWRKPDFTFHPWQFSGYEPADSYTKKTCLWTGNGFLMPQPFIDPNMGEPDNRIHFASPGADRANFRSATPMGFARAVFHANTRQTIAA
ncbi:hypothetical protein AB0284_21465 [Pseudarthrobacter phenanthrenivorans]|uniref:hypothetical protein n=1 Tax=Pseudarthrobacter phenanthrenivorans TaxID=361575 RepID=UPI00344DADBC